jgi:uncharacterized protein YgiB involved in biofilm formation
MKRTRFIDLKAMRKQPVFEFSKLATVIGGAIALGGCGGERTEAEIYRTLEACQEANPEQSQVCETAYQTALDAAQETAPRYARRTDCAAEFGDCTPARDAQGNSWFMPAMAGFMLAQALDGASGRRCPSGAYQTLTGCRYIQPVYTGHGALRGGYYGGDGTRYGDMGRGARTTVKVDPDALKPKPKVARTLSRGGFGSKAAAKSSWGGGSRSWGG